MSHFVSKGKMDSSFATFSHQAIDLILGMEPSRAFSSDILHLELVI